MAITFQKSVANEDGSTAIEYALIMSLVGLVIVGTLTLLGDDLAAAFTDFSSQLDADSPPLDPL